MVTYNEVNHYIYVAFHPIPDEAVIQDRMTRYHDKLADDGARRRQDVGGGVEAGGHRQERGRPRRPTTPGLTDAELVAKLDEFTDHMRYQWWIHGHINFVLLSSSAFCDLYDKLMRPGRVAPSRTRRSRASTPARSTSSGACGSSAAWPRPARRCASCSDAALAGRAARRARRDRGRSRLPEPARRVPLRVRLAQRRRVRPRRRAVAGGPVDPAGQRRRLHGPRRQPGSRAAVPAAGRRSARS